MKHERDGAAAGVEEGRREVEARLADLKAAIGRETGLTPRARYVILGVAAAATGFALAARRRKKKRSR